MSIIYHPKGSGMWCLSLSGMPKPPVKPEDCEARDRGIAFSPSFSSFVPVHFQKSHDWSIWSSFSQLNDPTTPCFFEPKSKSSWLNSWKILNLLFPSRGLAAVGIALGRQGFQRNFHGESLINHMGFWGSPFYKPRYWRFVHT